MAQMENRLGVRATYYFRADARGVFSAAEIAMIAGLGHEIGYHYEDLSFCKGHRDLALIRFHRNIETLRQLAPCVTVSMHGAPLSRYHNQDLLGEDDFVQASLLGDAVSSVSSFAPYYLTDTGGCWLAGKSNLRDRVGKYWPAHAVPVNMPAFKGFIAETRQPLYISTHPERWSATMPGYMSIKMADMAINAVKRVVRLARFSG